MSSETSIVECRAVIRHDGAVLAEGYDSRFRLATGKQSIMLTRVVPPSYPERLEVELLFYPSKLTDDERQELERLRKIIREDRTQGARYELPKPSGDSR